MLDVEINFSEEHKVLTTLTADAKKITVGVQFKGSNEFFSSLKERTVKGKNGDFVVYVHGDDITNTGYQMSRELVEDGVELKDLVNQNIYARYEWTKDKNAIGGEGWLTVKFSRYAPKEIVDSAEKAIKRAKELSTKERTEESRTASALERIASLGLKL